MQTLREAPVRDLAWLLLSADLLSAARFPAALAHFDRVDAALHEWLLACDADPGPLHEMLARGESHRLGRYAEQLLHFALLHSPAFDLLAAGLQVRDARRGNMTLGECDFLLARRDDRRLLHWELAVKLYLFVPPEAASGALVALDERAVEFRWLGPNLADSLADKVARLLGHQLRLTTLDAARSALPAPGPWLPQVYLKGWLFHPLGQGARLPQVASETHGKGWWATLEAWWAHAQATKHEQAWAMLPRARWLAPARVDNAVALSLDAMRARIEAHWHERGVAEPLLIVSLRRRADSLAGAINARDAYSAGASDWFEHERGFIVPDFWAPRARHRIEELSERAQAAARKAIAQSADDGAPSI
ncbi:DUF1853 family protein [Pandoraea anhela]|uniref:DUF1853 domain-containing protein n=1 Tax=Pandoraea anhela TaxID=2508295 RepID=A0A5E4VYC6_9BURK|nr:DUF1853 family protein [Pandoraea anhela]VVE15875.1 hypothetical protein PAN31108_02865 [Pandoraea anhela]